MNAQTISALIGVFHADGGLRGETAYIIGKIKGTTHCGLCDITHGLLGRKKDWQAMTATLNVPFELVHRNERTASVLAASGDNTPCVLARTDDGLHLLLGPKELDVLGGDVTAFATALHDAIRLAGLRIRAASMPTRKP